MGNGRISAKQAEILEYIKAQILEKGYPPAVREICSAVHLKSTSSVHSHLETLEKNGYIRRDPTKPRAIEIIDDDFNIQARNPQHSIVRTCCRRCPIICGAEYRKLFSNACRPAPCR